MPGRHLVDPRFAAELRRLRQARDLSLRKLAGLAYVAKSTISELENHRKEPTPETAWVLDKALRAQGRLAAMVSDAAAHRSVEQADHGDDEEQALELARRVAASDVGAETLAHIEAAVDDLATAPPRRRCAGTRRPGTAAARTAR